MTTTTRRRVLPADVYDTLELSALAFGGIGAGTFGDDTPCCASGHARFIDTGSSFGCREESPVLDALSNAFAETGVINPNDKAVRRINTRKGERFMLNARVSFAEWCAELNVVRGQ